jgi:DNA-binding transcriptional ArsR family regulator
VSRKKADIMLHPIRMRIIQELLKIPNQTVQHLIDHLEDVPQATMYRHLKLLLDAGLIHVVETNKVRGTVEKVYAVVTENLTISDEEIKETAPEEYLKYFMTYQANLLKEFERYVMSSEPQSYKENGLGFWQATLHLSDEELLEFGEKVGQLIQEAVDKKPNENRRARTVATILIPEAES